MTARQAAAPTSLDWDALLDDAISGDRLSLSFQPVVDIQVGRITGYETLARFQGPPDVGPEAWFAAARRSGRAAELDTAVVERALARWRSIPSNCFLTINVEPTSLPTALLAHTLATERRLDGLVIEVTEHVSLADEAGVFDALDRYRTMGASVAVDDAGSGYSGLQQILDLRPDFLKLDRSLVAGIDVDEAKLALLDMLGALANHLDAWIIAEGVEREPEVALLRDHGVPLAQGYYLAMPGPAWPPLTAEAEALLTGPTSPAPASLGPLINPTPWIRYGDVGRAGELLVHSGEDHLVVLDTDDRPVGLVDPQAAVDGIVLPVWKTNLHTELSEVAGRLATRPDARLPELVICHDDEGHYLGTIRVQRLLAALSTELRRRS